MKNKLSIRPVIKDEILWKENDCKVVLILKNKGFFNRMFQLIIKKPKISYIQLDEYGSFIWKNIDGKNTIADIATALASRYSDAVEPLYIRLFEYMTTLKENKIITFM